MIVWNALEHLHTVHLLLKCVDALVPFCTAVSERSNQRYRNSSQSPSTLSASLLNISINTVTVTGHIGTDSGGGVKFCQHYNNNSDKKQFLPVESVIVT